METTMTGVQRRKKILEMLGQSSTPLSGGALGRAVGVSRQVVVQDIALLRTEGHPVLATAAVMCWRCRTRRNASLKCVIRPSRRAKS